MIMAYSSNFCDMDKKKEYYKHLHSRHDSKTEQLKGEEVKEFYDRVADDFDDLATKAEFKGDINGSRELSKKLKGIGAPLNTSIADVGSGTGLVGQVLRNTYGYTNLIALDISSNMLEKAKKKNLYNDFIQCDLNTDKMTEYHQKYDHAISIGCFVLGNMMPVAMETIAKLVKPGGFVCISFRKKNLDDEYLGYKQKLIELENKYVWKEIIRVSDNYLKLDNGEIVEAYYIVFQVC